MTPLSALGTLRSAALRMSRPPASEQDSGFLLLTQTNSFLTVRILKFLRFQMQISTIFYCLARRQLQGTNEPNKRTSVERRGRKERRWRYDQREGGGRRTHTDLRRQTVTALLTEPEVLCRERTQKDRFGGSKAEVATSQSEARKVGNVRKREFDLVGRKELKDSGSTQGRRGMKRPRCASGRI